MARIIEDEVQNIIGEKVKELRIERQLSQQELSERLVTYAVNICRGSISRIEQKDRTVTDFELQGLAKALNVEITDLFN